MSILIIGGDQISQISSMLTQMGAKTINHWDARKKSSAPKKKVPLHTPEQFGQPADLHPDTLPELIRTASRFIFGQF